MTPFRIIQNNESPKQPNQVAFVAAGEHEFVVAHCSWDHYEEDEIMFKNIVLRHGHQAYHYARMLSEYPGHLVIYALALKFLEKGLATTYAQASMMASSWLMVYQATEEGERIFQEARQWLHLNASTPEQVAALERDQSKMQTFDFPTKSQNDQNNRLQ